MTGETSQQLPPTAHDALVRVVTDIENVPNLSQVLATAHHGFGLYETEVQTNPSVRSHQTGSELSLMRGKVLDRISRGEKDPTIKKRYLGEALEMVEVGLDIAKKTGNDKLLPIPLTYKADLLMKQGNYKAAETTYEEALSHALPEDHTPAFLLVIKWRKELAKYLDESSGDKDKAFKAAQANIHTLEEYKNPDEGPKLTDENRAKWVVGGHLNLATAVVQAGDQSRVDIAFTSFQTADNMIQEKPDVLRLRQEDANTTKELLTPLLDQEFAHAQALRNLGEKETSIEAIAAYERLREHANILGADQMAANAIHMIGVAKYQQEDYTGAEQAYKEAQAEFEKLHYDLLVAAVLRDLSSVAYKKTPPDFELAHKLIDEGLARLTDDQAEHKGMSRVRKGKIHLMQNNLEEAEQHAIAGVTLGDSVSEPTYFQARSRGDLAEILIAAKKYNEAKKVIEEAEEILGNVEKAQPEGEKVIFTADRTKLSKLKEQIAKAA